MGNSFNLINNFFVRLFAIITMIFTIITILKDFDVIQISKYGIKGVVSLILISIFIDLVIIPIKIRAKIEKNSPAVIEMEKKITKRMGTLLSSRTNDPKVIDRTHYYFSVFRQDLLDYTQKDYHSIRILKGINKSKTMSDGLIYSESTEYKIAFEHITFKAVDIKTGKDLLVTCLADKKEKLFTHVFKIHFLHSIKPEEEFEIGYYIKLPEELGVLSEESEMMSISLARITKGVDVLNFNVCLNFQPRSVKTYTFDEAKGTFLLNTDCNVEEYMPHNDIEKMFNIEVDWSSKPYIIKMKHDKPDKNVHIIEYYK